MLSRRLRPYAWMGMLVAAVVAAYSVMTIAMIASLSAAPNYVGDARRDVLLSEATLAICLAIAVVSIVVLVRTRQRGASDPRNRVGSAPAE